LEIFGNRRLVATSSLVTIGSLAAVSSVAAGTPRQLRLFPVPVLLISINRILNDRFFGWRQAVIGEGCQSKTRLINKTQSVTSENKQKTRSTIHDIPFELFTDISKCQSTNLIVPTNG
jgi:hypothetical protein